MDKKPRVTKNTMKTAARLLKYVTGTYKAEFIIVFVLYPALRHFQHCCVFLYADHAGRLHPALMDQANPQFAGFYKALAVLGAIFIVGVLSAFIYSPSHGPHRTGRAETGKG